MILSGSESHGTVQILARLFPRNEYQLADRRFSRLHKIILSLSPQNLEQELRTAGSTIDIVDSQSKTALSWAVQRRDLAATKLLLDAKANVNIPSISGDPPLAHAAYFHNLPLVTLLLHVGASVTPQKLTRISILHYASGAPMGCGLLEDHVEDDCPSSQIIKLLLAAGSEINQRVVAGSTPLEFATQHNNVHALQTLLRYGADIDSSDNTGETPLIEGIRFSKHDAVRLLLHKGANYLLTNNAGMTILHVAAQHGSLETIEILRNANLTKIDPYAKNKEGKTAFELAQKRDLKPEGFINLFLTLLFEIRNRNDSLAARQCADGIGDVTNGVQEEDNNGHGKGGGGSGSEVTMGIVESVMRVPGAWPVVQERQE